MSTMRNFETINDVIFFAIESEIQSVEFYNRLSEAALESETKALFIRLKAEEEDHIVRLQHLIDHQEEFSFISLSHHFSDEDYLSYIIPSPDVNIIDGLIIAIQKEKAAIRLYRDLAAETKKHHFNKIFLSLAAEEEKHCQKFENEYNAQIVKK
jgi:rubrerythrin